MRKILSAQQNSFFTRNGYIEFEMAHEVPPFLSERDEWRKDPALRDFLVRKLGPIVLSLSGKARLRLACDQWFSEENRPRERVPLKGMFNIQGLHVAVAMCDHGIIPKETSPLGILPVPKQGHLLFFRTDLILDWPHVSSNVYLALYSLPNAIYIHNPKDPFANSLKQFGYHFGDPLRNETHPLIF